MFETIDIYLPNLPDLQLLTLQSLTQRGEYHYQRKKNTTYLITIHKGQDEFSHSLKALNIQGLSLYHPLIDSVPL